MHIVFASTLFCRALVVYRLIYKLRWTTYYKWIKKFYIYTSYIFRLKLLFERLNLCKHQGNIYILKKEFSKKWKILHLLYWKYHKQFLSYRQIILMYVLSLKGHFQHKQLILMKAQQIYKKIIIMWKRFAVAKLFFCFSTYW
jgi:uncharacterized protein (UPF0332 family)